MTADQSLHYTDDPEANRLNASDPMALLIGFVLDQQVPVQKAFSGPLELKGRIGTLDARRIADMSPDDLEAAFAQRPALHRFPAAMAKRVQALAAAVAESYGDDASRIWTDAVDGPDLVKRIGALPGFGGMKVRSLTAVLGKRLGVRLPGMDEVMPSYPTLGDVDSAEALAEYQAQKRAYKAQLRESGEKFEPWADKREAATYAKGRR
ncbi:MAG TPA: HhH-GPD-type base excision DNA repair protein [Candidatus Limnocylindria bacterium]|nr:HhH-GPD-type base excision DNA repair protein [Candidatus Limnocylindria bacterium]